MKWGKIPQEHLEMREFPADTNAAAVILADYGTVTFDRDYSLTFERHRRIKILKEAGFDWGTHSIVYLAEGRAERVGKVRGQTLILGEDGKVGRHELSRKDVFDEDIDGRLRRTRFTLPALQPGAVIEYTYRVEAENPFLMPDWTFQTSEPTLWSEFRPEIPGRLHFVRATLGMSRPLDIEESNEALRPGGSAMIHRMVMKNVPALRKEPHMTTPNDFRATLKLQLSGYVEPGYGLRRVLHTWSEAASDLRDISTFKQFFKPPKAAREQAAAVTQGITEAEEKMRAVYDYVRSNVAWTGEMRILPDQNVDDVLKSKKGNSADIAVLLGAMLREAGLAADPVLISTRSHGAVLEVYPLLSQFNYLLVHVNVGGKSHFLDATDPLRPMDLLPLEVLNGRGWKVTEKEQSWISISSPGRFEHDAYIEAAVDPSGDMRALVHVTDRGYSALEGRTALNEEDDEHFVREVLLKGVEAEDVGTFTIEGKEPQDPVLSSRGEILLPAYAQVAGDMIYFNPKLLGRVDKNPFRLADRTFPVDYGYPSSWYHMVEFTPPEGYEVTELPSVARLRLASGGGLYHRTVTEEEGRYVIQTRFEISKSIFEPHEYGELRALYERAVALEGEQVVMKRLDFEAATQE